ncbi:MAG TPA: hypothetical protein VE152_10060, partial [Acidimicrobiales bacterium]|nr:hypothetical protein [Acidimicrobiales bacterium]
MTTPAVHQLLPSLLPGDAVGAHTLELRRALRAWGVASELWCESVHPDLAGEARPVAQLPRGDT